MKTTNTILGVLLLAAVGVGSYMLGTRSRAPAVDVVSAAVSASGPANATTVAPRKLLYYRNPMGLPDTSPTPKKDPMGMDYIPVYEGEEPASDPGSANLVRISTEKVQKLGVRVEAAAIRSLDKVVRAALETWKFKAEGEKYVGEVEINFTLKDE